jgi:hypothetical protein
MAARITEVRDAAADRVREWWDPTGPDEVRGCYRFDYDSRTAAGRKVFVLPVSYTGSPVTRREDADDYALAVVVVERFPAESAGDPDEAWVDERVEWVEDLLNLLGNARGANLLADPGDPTSGLWPETAEATAVCDLEDLMEKKVFLAVLNVTYREHATHTPEV